MKNPRERNNLRDSNGHSTRTLPSLIAVATFVLIIASLYWAQAVLIPVALAILLTFLLSPVAGALERIALGRLPSVILIVVLTFSLLGGIGWIVTLQFESLANELPTYRKNIRQKIADIREAGKGGALEKLQKTAEDVKEQFQKNNDPARVQEKPREVVVKAEESSTFWPVPLAVGPMVERFASAGLVIVLVIFMLIYREDLRNRLIRLIGYGRLTVTTKALEEAGQPHKPLFTHADDHQFLLWFGDRFGSFLISVPYAILWGFLRPCCVSFPMSDPFRLAIMPGALSLAVFEGWLWPIVVVGLFLVLELSIIWFWSLCSMPRARVFRKSDF